MKNLILKNSWMILVVLSFSSCRVKTYDRIKQYIDKIKVIDTHEHQRSQKDYNFDRCLSYFNADIVAAGSLVNFNELEKKNNWIDSVWDAYGKYIDYGRATTYYDEWLKGFQLCHHFSKRYVSREDVPALAKIVSEKYKNYDQWFDENFRKFNFEIMILDQYWYQYNINIDTAHFALVFRVDSAVTDVSEAAAAKMITGKSVLKLLNRESIPAATLDAYLAVMDTVTKIFIDHKAVCLKNALAYHRSIDFEDVSYDDAKKLFAKPGSLNEIEKKKLEDFMFHWFIQKSIEYKVPVQIHTGYLAGNSGILDNGHPMKLLPLFKKYPEAKFDLFHGGYPWIGDFVSLGKNFPNVYTNIVWLPQISRTAAIRGLHELLDCVPYNKICWGGDIGTIEQAVGSLELGKEVVATVLAERIEKGWLTEEVAQDIARKIFRENAIAVYHLTEKRNIK